MGVCNAEDGGATVYFCTSPSLGFNLLMVVSSVVLLFPDVCHRTGVTLFLQSLLFFFKIYFCFIYIHTRRGIESPYRWLGANMWFECWVKLQTTMPS